jgi:hypothetical protein
MSATRVGLMMKRFARAVPLGGARAEALAQRSSVARNVDFNLFTGRSFDDDPA